MRIFAVDPGTEMSAVVEYTTNRLVVRADILRNEELIKEIKDDALHGCSDVYVFEMIESMGMAVGRETFQTVLWIGRMYQECVRAGRRTELVYRSQVKLAICNDRRARDANIRAEIADRFGGKLRAFGSKKNPGPLFGVTSHKMSALAVAIAFIDMEKERAENETRRA